MCSATGREYNPRRSRYQRRMSRSCRFISDLGVEDRVALFALAKVLGFERLPIGDDVRFARRIESR